MLNPSNSNPLVLDGQIDEKDDFFASVWEDTTQNLQASAYNPESPLLSDSPRGESALPRSSATSQGEHASSSAPVPVATIREALKPFFDELHARLDEQSTSINSLVSRLSNIESSVASICASFGPQAARGALVPPLTVPTNESPDPWKPACTASVRESKPVRSEKEIAAELEAKKEAEWRRAEEQRLRKEAEDKQRAEEEKTRLEAEKRKELMEEKRKQFMSTLITGGKGDLFGDAAPKKLGLFDD